MSSMLTLGIVRDLEAVISNAALEYNENTNENRTIASDGKHQCFECCLIIICIH